MPEDKLNPEITNSLAKQNPEENYPSYTPQYTQIIGEDWARTQPYSNTEIFKESAKLMWQDTTLGVLQRKSNIDNARKLEDRNGIPIDNPILTKEQANEEYGKYGVHFDKAIRRNEADVIAAQKVREEAQKERLQQSEGTFLSGAASIAGTFAGAMLDPVGIATSFIPLTRVVPALKTLEAAGFWGKVAVKGLDGLVMNSLLEPAPVLMSNIDQRDYTMADSLLNVAAGGLFGAGIGAFTEGVRLATKGEIFNMNKAATTALANNQNIETLADFSKKYSVITSMTYDDLITLPDNRVHIAEDNGKFIASLSEDGPLNILQGQGKTAAEAKAHLREQIGELLENDSIIAGYRIDDALDAFHDALKKSEKLSDSSWLPRWIKTLQDKAARAGLPLQDYVAKATDNYTNFEKLIKRAEQSRTMQKRLGNLSGKELDDAIEQGAVEIEAYAIIKDAFKANPRPQVDFKTYIEDYREKSYNKKTLAQQKEFLEAEIARLEQNRNNLQKQLDNSELTATEHNLTSEIDSINTSIETNNKMLNELLEDNTEFNWKSDDATIRRLEAMRAKLEQDPRTFEDVREQLTRQTDLNETWDTSQSILDDIFVEDIEFTDVKKLDALIDDIAGMQQSLHGAVKKLNKDELAALGFTKAGMTTEMVQADKKMTEMDEFIKGIDDYGICRQTEV